jgi:hypothetical protein
MRPEGSATPRLFSSPSAQTKIQDVLHAPKAAAHIVECMHTLSSRRWRRSLNKYWASCRTVLHHCYHGPCCSGQACLPRARCRGRAQSHPARTGLTSVSGSQLPQDLGVAGTAANIASIFGALRRIVHGVHGLHCSAITSKEARMLPLSTHAYAGTLPTRAAPHTASMQWPH